MIAVVGSLALALSLLFALVPLRILTWLVTGVPLVALTAHKTMSAKENVANLDSAGGG